MTTREEKAAYITGIYEHADIGGWEDPEYPMEELDDDFFSECSLQFVRKPNYSKALSFGAHDKTWDKRESENIRYGNTGEWIWKDPALKDEYSEEYEMDGDPCLDHPETSVAIWQHSTQKILHLKRYGGGWLKRYEPEAIQKLTISYLRMFEVGCHYARVSANLKKGFVGVSFEAYSGGGDDELWGEYVGNMMNGLCWE